MTKSNQKCCPLCHGEHVEFYHEDKARLYMQCHECKLVYVPAEYHISAEIEKAEYDKHDNLNLDEGYRRFLNRTLEPLLIDVRERFTGEVNGLDFGCGEGRHISSMAKEQGIQMEDYDLYYYHYPQHLTQCYEFVTMTEVIEHLADAKGAFLQLKRLLKSDGLLAIMTKRVIDKTAFSKWHYKNDPTHICFYSEETFRFVADWLDMELRIVGSDVVFLVNK